MHDKGYAFPLYCLDLTSPLSVPAAEAPYAIPVPGGRLLTRPSLRRRAVHYSSETVYRALAEALVRHRERREGFSRFGLDGEWAESMAHWGQQLLARDSDRGRRHLESGAAAGDHAHLLREARDLWARLLLSARLSGLGPTLAAGRAPRAALPLLDLLSAARDRIAAGDLAPQLAGHGFGPDDRAALDRVLLRLLPLHQERTRARRAVRDAGGPLLTVRGALLGDLTRLCATAPRVLAGARPPTLQGLLALQG